MKFKVYYINMETIYTSIHDNNLNTLKILLDGADSTLLNNSLECAIVEKNLTMVKYIVEQGASLQTSNSMYAYDAFYIAINTEYMPIIEYMASCGAVVHLKHLHKVDQNINLYKYLVELYMQDKTNIPIMASLLLDYTLGHIIPNIQTMDKFKYLISLGSDITQRNYCLLIFGIVYQQMWIIQLFFNGDIRLPQYILQEGLISAIFTGNLDIIKYLINHGSKPDIPGVIDRCTNVDNYEHCNKSTPMNIALQREDKAIIEYLENI